MATMLVSAAEANLLHSHSWRILRELNVLCDPRAAMHPRADAFLIAPDLSDSALRMQRDAVEGARPPQQQSERDAHAQLSDRERGEQPRAERNEHPDLLERGQGDRVLRTR